jgi:malate/lactate dehydrogenase
MRSKITVVGESGSALAHALSDEGRCTVVSLAEGSPDLAGADVVVIAGGDVAAAAEAAARRASGSVLLVATPHAEADTAIAVERSLLPRSRVVGVARDDVPTAAEAVLYGKEAELRAAVLCRGEEGIDDRVATVPVRLGARGVRRIGAAPGEAIQ